MFKFFKKIEFGAGAIIIKENKILLTKRNIDPYSGHWEIPAGHVKSGEKARATVVREVLEETAILLKKVNWLSWYFDIRHNFICSVFYSNSFLGEAANIDEFNHSDLTWFDIDALPSPLGPSVKRGMQILKFVNARNKLFRIVH